MPTPSGVNYLLQSLQSFLIPQLSKDKNQKWTSSLMSLYFICPLAYLFYDYTVVWENPHKAKSVCKFTKSFRFQIPFTHISTKKSSELFVDSKKYLSLQRQIPPASHKNSVPSGTFFVYRHEIYQTSNDAGTADSDTARQRSDDC